MANLDDSQVEAQTCPNRAILIDDPYHDWDRDCVEFRLTYEGSLLASGNVREEKENIAKAIHKQEMRKVFHKQLKRLWDNRPALKSMLNDPQDFLSVNRVDRTTRFETLPQRFACGKYRLLPLVTEDLNLICGIDILFLRPDKESVLTKLGDIDNRLKTLFDALRMPGPDTKELGGLEPTRDEDPFYCLLEDDSLISRVSLETDTLLQPTNPEVAENANDARLIISVKLKPTDPSIYSTMIFS